LSQDRRITHGGRKGFGSGALKVGGKIFAMLDSKNQFVVKLPKERMDELVVAAIGRCFEPRSGKPMKEWFVVTRLGQTGPSSLEKRASSSVAASRNRENMSAFSRLNR